MDEDFKVDDWKPKGLKLERDTIKTGQSDFVSPASAGAADGRSSNTRSSACAIDCARGVAGKEGNWGMAMATSKQSGQVRWSVELNPEAGC